MALVDRSLCNNTVTYQQASRMYTAWSNTVKYCCPPCVKKIKVYYYLRVRVYSVALLYWVRLLVLGPTSGQLTVGNTGASQIFANLFLSRRDR